jgi:GNAT superfamily N-acetyltransferase
MIVVSHTNIYRVGDYSKHLKNLPKEDTLSRFGHMATAYTIDQLMLQLVYNPSNHELWVAKLHEVIVGWGHMARNTDGSWELALSVEHDYQRQGIGNKLIGEMLSWAKVHHVSEVFMHCIEDNRVIQHLAGKYELQTRTRSSGERTAALIVPEPTFLEVTDQRWKEQTEIFTEFAKLRKRLTDIWSMSIVPK